MNCSAPLLTPNRARLVPRHKPVIPSVFTTEFRPCQRPRNAFGSFGGVVKSCTFTTHMGLVSNAVIAPGERKAQSVNDRTMFKTSLRTCFCGGPKVLLRRERSVRVPTFLFGQSPLSHHITTFTRLRTSVVRSITDVESTYSQKYSPQLAALPAIFAVRPRYHPR